MTALLAAAAGDADTAARLAAAGVDVLVAYHSSALRRRGFPSVAGLLPWANANELTLAIAAEVVAAAAGRPVLATVCANDGLRPPEQVVTELAGHGVTGVLNAPTTALLSGPVRSALEDAGLGYRREVELMALAREHGLLAWGYACTPAQAVALVAHGADAVVVHLGITREGPLTARHTTTLARVAAAALAVRPDVRLLAHGGPLTHPTAFPRTGHDGVHFGFFGASVFERAEDPDSAVAAWRLALRPKGDR
ncbi:phosphoenolpyruvate hydrolase family protein [Goodfellowiella coeruleoviolacea]|uniref:TIM-barrel enzyme n=1 Tax=Goodfellowiella coeruleoviolacea TaxID=334858 RepID=A0AAE3G7V9_9PSEU|nr:phosphoenolpyruvate hydrolase family protein [Goodfellowiella coeruleoviolacea]MCP2163180.1 putative TIM-barrel enzyme [Goodfellowiella coeruleoviolacea]